MASIAPPETEPNHEMARDILIFVIVMLVVPMVVLILRIWSRLILPDHHSRIASTRLWWDDWAVVLAVCIHTVFCGITLKTISIGAGLRYPLTPSEIESDAMRLFARMAYTSIFMFTIGTTAVRASALFFYARVFDTINPRFRLAMLIMHILNFLWTVATILSITFQCNPIRKSWLPLIPGTCAPTWKIWMGGVIPALFIDVAILILPLPMLWNLKLPLDRKLLLGGVFLCAYGVVVVGIGRLIIMAKAGNNLAIDPTYRKPEMAYWTLTEIPIASICVSFPSIFSLVRRAYYHGWRSLFTTETPKSRSIPSTDTHAGANQQSSERSTISSNQSDIADPLFSITPPIELKNTTTNESSDGQVNYSHP